MCRGKCPLENICKQRLDVANAVFDAENRATSQQVEHLTQQARENTGNAVDCVPDLGQVHKSFIGFHETLLAVQRSLGNVGLALQISDESRTQAFERFNCPGAIKKRQFGFFGKVMELACGSESRVDRLKDHLVRLEPPDEWTVEN